MLSRAALILFSLVLFACGGEVPSLIRDEMAVTASRHPDSATVVFFTDFQCPHCRRTHEALAPVVQARRGRVRVVLRHVPLPRHPDARTAARAAVCFEEITKAWGDASFEDYTHALFAAEDLSEAACEDLAVEHGLDRQRFQRCLADASTDARIERDLAMFDAVKGDGVPLLYVGRSRLDGAQSKGALELAVDEAISQK